MDRLAILLSSGVVYCSVSFHCFHKLFSLRVLLPRSTGIFCDSCQCTRATSLVVKSVETISICSIYLCWERLRFRYKSRFRCASGTSLQRQAIVTVLGSGTQTHPKRPGHLAGHMAGHLTSLSQSPDRLPVCRGL